MSVLVVAIIVVLVLVDGQGMSSDYVEEKFNHIGLRYWLRVGTSTC